MPLCGDGEEEPLLGQPGIRGLDLPWATDVDVEPLAGLVRLGWHPEVVADLASCLPPNPRLPSWPCRFGPGHQLHAEFP